MPMDASTVNPRTREEKSHPSTGWVSGIHGTTCAERYWSSCAQHRVWLWKTISPQAEIRPSRFGTDPTVYPYRRSCAPVAPVNALFAFLRESLLRSGGKNVLALGKSLNHSVIRSGMWRKGSP